MTRYKAAPDITRSRIALESIYRLCSNDICSKVDKVVICNEENLDEYVARVPQAVATKRIYINVRKAVLPMRQALIEETAHVCSIDGHNSRFDGHLVGVYRLPPPRDTAINVNFNITDKG